MVSSCTGLYEYELLNKVLLLQLSVWIQSTTMWLNTLYTTVNDVISNVNSSSGLPFITAASCVYSSQVVSQQATMIPIKYDRKVYSLDELLHAVLIYSPNAVYAFIYKIWLSNIRLHISLKWLRSILLSWRGVRHRRHCVINSWNMEKHSCCYEGKNITLIVKLGCNTRKLKW